MKENKEKKEDKKIDFNELAQKYNVNLKELEEEQKKLAKSLSLKDAIDFSLADKIAGIETTFFQNKIISVIVILNQEMEIIEQQYSSDIIRFPYIPGFRAYRELPSMISAFNKLEERPDIVFISGQGIAHPRLGLASHFSLSTGIPSIGIADSLMNNIKADEEDILLEGKKVGKVLKSKEYGNPLYISPGDLVSIKTSLELTKKFIIPPHKYPEPLHIARKYAKDTREELFQMTK